jgi:ABC-type Mn2+/Zn2+ transport system permease subunit
MFNLLSPLLIKSYISIILLGIMSIGGTLAFMRGVPYLPGESSHAALGGVSLAILIVHLFSIPMDPLIWAVIFSALSSLLVAYAGRHGGAEALNAALAGAMALSLAVYATVRAIVPAELRALIDTYLVSDILFMTTLDIMQLSLIVLVGLLILVAFYHELMYICFDAEGAEAMGLNVKFFDYLLFLLIGVAGGIAAKTVGSLLVFALVIAPAATAREISTSINRFILLTFSLTVLLGFTGLFIALSIDWPPSGAIALLTSAVYIITVIIKNIFYR